jgi:hypothetical protein
LVSHINGIEKFANTVLRRTLGSKTDGMTGSWKRTMLPKAS